MSHPKYPDEFKLEAVKQITQRGHKVADVSERLVLASTACTNGLRPTQDLPQSDKPKAPKPKSYANSSPSSSE